MIEEIESKVLKKKLEFFEKLIDRAQRTCDGRERIAKTLSHQEADRVPLDFGATTTSGIMASTLYKIKKHYGLFEAGERIKIIEPYQMLGEIDKKTREFFGIDTVGILPRGNMFGFPNENWKPWTLFDGTPVWVPEQFNTEPDENGNILMYPQGDKNCAPCAVMPQNGFYFDAIVRQKPVDENNLNPSDNLEEFGVLSKADITYFQSEVERLYATTDSAIALTVPGTAFGDIALVPATFLKDPKGIRDISEWYMSSLLRPDYMKKVFEVQAEIGIENLKLLYAAIGNKIQIVFMSGTDFGSQNSPMMSEAMYRDMYLPYQKKLNDWIHKHTTWKTFMHSCGSIMPLLECIIEAGFDILNPVQCSAVNMDPAVLKERYGKRIVFWGGGVDTQKTLPFGSLDEIRNNVACQIDAFKKGGGFVFSTVHNLQAGVPPENVAAMMETYLQKCQY
jgi:uroporphyrinogen-III decarboxylase